MEKADQVLLALYAEAVHGGSFAEVTRTSMGMEKGDFGWALYNLQMRGMISGCAFQPPRPDTAGNLMGVIRNGLALTPTGYRTAETMAGEDGGTGEKLQAIWTILRDAGCGIMANIIYGWL